MASLVCPYTSPVIAILLSRIVNIPEVRADLYYVAHDSTRDYCLAMQRRHFIVGAAMAASVPLAAACSRDQNNGSGFQPLSMSDERVQNFMKFYNEFWTDPAKAVQQYTTPDVVYTSTSGQDFDQAGLTSRLNDWAQGFTRVKSEPVFAAALDKGEILIVLRDTSVHSGQFRGNAATNKDLVDDSIFTVAYDSKNRITRYSQYADYGGISDTVGADNLSQLHGMA